MSRRDCAFAVSIRLLKSHLSLTIDRSLSSSSGSIFSATLLRDDQRLMRTDAFLIDVQRGEGFTDQRDSRTKPRVRCNLSISWRKRWEIFPSARPIISLAKILPKNDSLLFNLLLKERKRSMSDLSDIFDDDSWIHWIWSGRKMIEKRGAIVDHHRLLFFWMIGNEIQHPFHSTDDDLIWSRRTRNWRFLSRYSLRYH